MRGGPEWPGRSSAMCIATPPPPAVQVAAIKCRTWPVFVGYVVVMHRCMHCLSAAHHLPYRMWSSQATRAMWWWAMGLSSRGQPNWAHWVYVLLITWIILKLRKHSSDRSKLSESLIEMMLIVRFLPIGLQFATGLINIMNLRISVGHHCSIFLPLFSGITFDLYQLVDVVVY